MLPHRSLRLGAVLLTVSSLAGPAGAQVDAVTAIALPQAPPPLGLPTLQSQVSCPALQARLRSALAGESAVWSVSVADAQGRLLADVNGLVPRIPASNQKLVSTALALDRLGPDYSLTTRLWRRPDGSLR
ncbi:MAG: D-alanyl-D-alanine carboxypeptidase, partial [Cyanobacteria bacterium M_surface_10_m1_298]|nr:D-alanyl-D-alanine carboxypeptidase [Cyanobacteria bacterium M_surface_10_m1_298]